MMIAWLLVPAAIVVFLLWYSVTGRHADRSLANAIIVYAGMIVLTFLSAMSLQAVALFAGSLLSGSTSPQDNLQVPASFVFVFSSIAGVYLAVHTVRTKPPLHVLTDAMETRRWTARLCAWMTALLFLALPAVTYVTLLMNFGSYASNKFNPVSDSVSAALEIVLREFHVFFVTMFWWPFLVMYLLLSRLIAKSDVARRTAVFIVVATLLCFSIPYASMLSVLAFDVMEWDFPVPTSTAYFTFFSLLAPGIGAALASIPLIVAFFALKRSEKSAA